MSKTVLGHIPCPSCGQQMRITHDKNEHPFGFCEDGCGQQLRVGGKPSRVRAFVARYPWAAAGAPVTVTVPEPAPVPAPAPAAPKTAPVPAPAPKAAPTATPPAPKAAPEKKAEAPKPSWFTPIMGVGRG